MKFQVNPAQSKFYLHNFLDNIVVQIHAKHGKDRMKIEGVYLIWKKVDGWPNGRMDRRTTRHRISSAVYVSSGDKDVIKLLDSGMRVSFSKKSGNLWSQYNFYNIFV